LFTSTFEYDKAFHSNVYRYSIDHARLDTLADKKWNEHAMYAPSWKRIVWMSGRDNRKGATDYWSMNPDGSDKVRLTDFSNPDLPTFKNKAIVAADASLSPDGKFLIAYLKLNLVTQEGVTVLIELEDNWERKGKKHVLQ
jgi:Tol biopolymer transport system component